jgi:hypothetical protein
MLMALLRFTGASLIVLSLFHVFLWRTLGWGETSERLSPLTARVFLVHTFFIAFVLCALGGLSLFKPGLLLEQGELARLLLSTVVLFWVARLVIQLVIFDRLMRVGWTRSRALRFAVCLLWLGYVVVYGAALLGQYGAG